MTRLKYAVPASKAFEDRGAATPGGRWNHAGTPAGYAASSRSLAALEYLAHIPSTIVPSDLAFVSISFAPDLVEKLDPIPDGWDETGSVIAAEIGTAWLRSMQSAILAVPAVMVKSEMNYVINPRHPRFGEIVVHDDVEPFEYDSRLL